MKKTYAKPALIIVGGYNIVPLAAAAASAVVAAKAVGSAVAVGSALAGGYAIGRAAKAVEARTDVIKLNALKKVMA